MDIPKVNDVNDHQGNVEQAYKDVCEFSKAYYEDIIENAPSEIFFKSDREDLEQEAKKYESYQELYQNEFKDRFEENFENLYIRDLYNELGNDTFVLILSLENKIRDKYYEQATKEIDLDSDGVPDRIDIDDHRASVQTIDDLDGKNDQSKKTIDEKEDFLER